LLQNCLEAGLGKLGASQVYHFKRFVAFEGFPKCLKEGFRFRELHQLNGSESLYSHCLEKRLAHWGRKGGAVCCDVAFRQMEGIQGLGEGLKKDSESLIGEITTS